MRLLITVIYVIGLYHLICLVSAKKQKPRKLSPEQAKAVLDELTYIKEQQIYNIDEIEDEKLEKEITKEAQRHVENVIKNPCSGMKCNQGQICALNENYEATCTCAEFCAVPENKDTNICATNNITYPSECEFYRRKCLKPKLFSDVEVDYFGSCLDADQMCSSSELLTMPALLYQWFYLGMGDLITRETGDVEVTTISQEEGQDKRKFPKRLMKQLRYRFNMMDDSPQDRKLSHIELSPVRAPLAAVQPCVIPFLTSCDTDTDSYINMEEWLSCFK